jgi:hypothetical protein
MKINRAGMNLYSKMGGALMLALLWMNGTFAQCPQNNVPRNEIGIRLGSVTNASNFGGRYLPAQTMTFGYLNGLHYKRYGGLGAFRTSLSFTKYNIEERTNCPECLYTSAKVSGGTFRIGYEWYAVLGPLEPYVGIDALAIFGKYAGSTWSGSSTNYQEISDVRTRRGMGLSPVAGLRFYLGYAVSISAETSLDAMFLGKSTRIAKISPEGATYARSLNYFETVFQPLNWVSLNVMF